jgi:hypothetical protein
VLFGLIDELYFTRHKVENLSHQLHPLVELVRGLFINRPARFAPIFRSQPRLSVRARKRALVALNALWSVIRITLISKRRRRFRNRREVNAGIKLPAEFEIVSNDLRILRL